jgi:hypothetical protein
MSTNKSIVIYIIQIVAIYHAINQGWKIKKIGNRTYELSKNISDTCNFNLKNFINQITVLPLNCY